nr:MAG TPA: ELK domain [Caudoviricetes sp.]
MKVYRMTVIDIVRRKFGGHLSKLKNIILILFMLV